MTNGSALSTILLSGTLAAAGANALPVEVVADGGFEGGTPSAAWSEFSTNFGTPICNLMACGQSGARTGTYWAWLGGIDAAETAFVSQDVTMPAAGIATLGFWLAIPAADPVIGADTFQVTLDGLVVFATSNSDPAASHGGYVFHGIDVSSFADGGMHTLRFQGDFDVAYVTSFFLDDVSLTVQEPGSLSLLALGLAGLAHWARESTSFRRKC